MFPRESSRWVLCRLLWDLAFGGGFLKAQLHPVLGPGRWAPGKRILTASITPWWPEVALSSLFVEQALLVREGGVEVRGGRCGILSFPTTGEG